MKLPDPHKLNHTHYKHCCGLGLFAVVLVNAIGFHMLETFEAVIGLFILYDPTGMISS